jgi:hypothetical protein
MLGNKMKNEQIYEYHDVLSLTNGMGIDISITMQSFQI